MADNGNKGPTKKGMQDIKADPGDYGAREAWGKAENPSSVNDAAKGSTNYKHRAS